MNDELIQMDAVTVVELLRAGEVSPAEMLRAAYDRIRATDGAVNAMPTLARDRAFAQAEALGADSGEAGFERDAAGWLAGLPLSVKDLNPVAGIRTTFGSPIFRDHVPSASDYMVERLERRGAITLGKSNTPEFGAGANTFNEVFGVTRNPWNTALTCGGSSGGAAVGLATGQSWLATGTDFGGSLRTPAAFCGVVGMRPTFGTVAVGPAKLALQTLSVAGPMARRVADMALMLDAMAGFDSRDPLSRAAAVPSYLKAARNGAPPARVAWGGDLGITALDPEIRALCEDACRRGFGALGTAIEDTRPDLSAVNRVFHILRAQQYAIAHWHAYTHHRAQLKSDIVWNVEQGLAGKTEDLAWAALEQTAIIQRVARFFEKFDLLVCPTAICRPFAAEETYLREIDGHMFDNYMDWLTITFVATIAGCPALSLPCGFTRDGLPVGLQLIAPSRREDLLLGYALRLEEALALGPITPIDPRSAVA